MILLKLHPNMWMFGHHPMQLYCYGVIALWTENIQIPLQLVVWFQPYWANPQTLGINEEEWGISLWVTTNLQHHCYQDIFGQVWKFEIIWGVYNDLRPLNLVLNQIMHYHLQILFGAHTGQDKPDDLKQIILHIYSQTNHRQTTHNKVRH